MNKIHPDFKKYFYQKLLLIMLHGNLVLCGGFSKTVILAEMYT